MNPSGMFRVFSCIALLAAPAISGGFSRLPSGARAVALGGSLVSFSDDPYVLFYNPAGIAELHSLTIGAGYTQLFPGIVGDRLALSSLAAAANLGFLGTVGVGVKSFTSTFWNEYEIIGTYAQNVFGVIAVGGSAKLLHWSAPEPEGRFAVADPLGSASKSTVSFDAGVQATFRNVFPDNDVLLGVSAADITQPSIATNGADEGRLDMRLSSGVSYISRVYHYVITLHYAGMGDFTRLGVGTEILAVQTSFSDIPAELVVRAGGGTGLNNTAQGDITAGFGLLVHSLRVDYAFGQPSALQYVGGTHHLSLRYTF